MVEALSKQVKDRDDLGLAFIDKLSMQFDDHLAHQKIYQNESKKSSGIKSIVDRHLVKLGFRNDKLIDTDPVIQNFINELSKKGHIKSSQLELLNIYKMIGVDVNGSYFVVKPEAKDYNRAKLQVLLLIVLIIMTLGFVWEISKCIYPGLPIAFILGSALGLLWRGTYNLAWGRAKLARLIVSRYPWFRLVN
jgi:hypothetical protein